jgi:hypothetical protein
VLFKKVTVLIKSILHPQDIVVRHGNPEKTTTVVATSAAGK